MYRSSRRPTCAGLCLLFACCGLVTTTSRADVRLPHVIGDHMVLQRDMPVPIWGWADPGEAVIVTIRESGGDGQVANSKADVSGAWQVKLRAMSAGGPHKLFISTGKKTLTLTDILVGEVWLCSGQSNMEMGISMVKDAKSEVEVANYPQIRLLQVPHRPAGEPSTDIEVEWRACTPESIAQGGWGGFSAVGYFFGRELHKELKVPIGLINDSWGGTRIEPWTPAAAFTATATLGPIREKILWANLEYRKALPSSLDSIESWMRATREALSKGTEPPPVPNLPHHPLASEEQPTGLYNGMIHPLVPLAIRGAVWYQGESNAITGDGMAYLDKMKALVGGWRKVWGEGDFPFYFVQLAPFRYTQYFPNFKSQQFAELCEAQTAALAIPNTGMVVTTDIADLVDIHPKDKQTVAHRLALWALAKTYRREGLVYSGPLFKSMSLEDGKIRVRFDHVGGGLASHDSKPLTWFEIAGADKKFVKADAKIDGDSVLVSSKTIKEPAAVRFGWSMEAQPNLMNKEGLPASPFRMDK
jgi:sialate O-acetylesterase